MILRDVFIIYVAVAGSDGCTEVSMLVQNVDELRTRLSESHELELWLPWCEADWKILVLFLVVYLFKWSRRSSLMHTCCC